MNIWKKAIFSIIAVVITLTSVLPSNIYAQAEEEEGPWYAPTLEQFTRKVNDAPEDEIYGERYTQAQVYWIMYSLVNFAIGERVSGCTADATQALPCIQAIFSDSTQFIPGTTSANDMGIVFPLAFMVDQIIAHRPASGLQYVAYKLDKLDPVDNAYAQTGFGYETLSPAIPLWTATRNASYALMVVAIIILAFMIMFRSKISPQASLTVQVAIPRVVIALVLITFSFAIAGFLIDLAYLALGVIGAIFSFAGVSTLTPAAMFSALQSWGNGMLAIGLIIVVLTLAPAALAMLVPFPPVQFIGFIAGAIILILVLIAYIVMLVKILWLMFKSMITITLLIIFSPLYILMGVVTGGGFGKWIKMFVGNLSIFVTVPTFILLANIIMWGSFGPTSGSILDASTWTFVNPYAIKTTLLAGGVALPGFFGGFNLIFGLIGAVVLLMSAPKLASGIRDQIIMGRAQFGPDFGAFSAGIGAGAMVPGYIIDQKIAAKEAAYKSASDANAAVAAGQLKMWQTGKSIFENTIKRGKPF